MKRPTTKTELIRFRLTPDERKALEAIAKRCGHRSLSSALRSLIMLHDHRLSLIHI